MSSVAELRQLLKEDATGKNLYDHLTETLMKILLDKPKNAYDSFETISADVKMNTLDPNPEKGKPLPMNAAQLEKQIHWTSTCEALLKIPEEPTEEGGVKFQTLYPDDKEALAWAGVSLGAGETYRLFLSIKKLSEGQSNEVEKLRLFGKIQTRSKPYYVVEGCNPDEEEGADATTQEGKTGVNKNAYWVSQNIEGGDWTRLPDATMAQIVTARLTKKLLTGDLAAPVNSFPPFDGVESNLLRVQIARISAATSISPDGYFTLSEEEVPLVVSADNETINGTFPKASGDLKEPDAWKHHETGLNKLGRVQPMPEILDAAGEPIVPEEEVEVFPPLNGIKPELWTFRTSPGGAGSSPNSMVIARSLRWPGAVAVAYGRKFINVYVGNAIANDTVKRNPETPSLMTYAAYAPPLPKTIEIEWQAPPEEEEGGLRLVENPDAKADPTPPKAAGEEEEES